MDIKKEISEIISSNKSDADKLWNLARLIQRLPEFFNGILDQKISEFGNILKSDFGKEIEATKKLMPDLDKVLESVRGKDSKIPGPKGDKPVAGVDYHIPQNGKDYILTMQDKQEIASKIRVPIVEKVIEKTEIIKEIPKITEITNNIIKEIAIAETPEQIAKKINSLENVLKMSLVIGLEDRLNKIAWIRGRGVSKGGGMGDWIHQSFDVDSATTSITVSDDIAGNGFALLAFYQGQNIFRGTHYTQSGRNLALLFTPSDNSIIDITFVR